MKSTVIPLKIKRILKFYIEVMFVIKFKDYVYDGSNVSRLTIILVHIKLTGREGRL